ncbi:PREDICTED: ribonuclease 2-like [Ipomoea nil]|uniref:ribonuclease 2-like n=1 Tax=Ipomoea nil TaxID=35883 RepID=UPI0009019BCF|nr:PREDICTED: ribonuclease 2-like [Ipomoea nil]
MASLPKLIILPLFLLLLGIAVAPLKAKDPEFDYFTLSLVWSGTMCLNVKECCSTNACCKPIAKRGFTIRGLWPEYNNGTRPSCCNGEAFNKNEISGLRKYLEYEWPSYNCTLSSACGSPKESNWAYEWAKHGICANSVIYHHVFNYFFLTQMALRFYDVTRILKNSGYRASDSADYSVRDITFAIRSRLSATPIVLCYGDAVKEVQLCFNKKLQPIDCPTTKSGLLYKSSSDECPSRVRLPKLRKKNVISESEKMNDLSFSGVQNW